MNWNLNFRNRIIIILYILSITASLFIFAGVMDDRFVNMEYNAYSHYSIDGNNIYYTQNLSDKGLIFKMDGGGKVSKIFATTQAGEERVLGVSTYDGNVYAVLSSYVEDKTSGEGETITAYRIACLDSKLSVLTKTEKFALDKEEVLSGFSAEPTGLFMTMLKKDGSYTKTYGISLTALKPENELDGSDIRVENVRSREATDGRFFSQAVYMYGQLYVRTDADVPSGVFEQNKVVINAVSNMRLTIGQMFKLYSVYFIWYIAILIVWLLLLYLMIRLLSNRNRSVYFVIIAEVILAAIIGAGLYTITTKYEEARSTEHSRFAVISLLGLYDDTSLSEDTGFNIQGFYDTERYQEIRRALTGFVRKEGNDEIFYDVLVVNLGDYGVCASASGKNLQTINTIYGEAVTDLITDIYKGERYTAKDITLEGQDYRAVAVAESSSSTGYALFGIINSSSASANVFVDNTGVIILFIFLFALGSALVVLIWYFQSRDLRLLEHALSETAMGREIGKRPVVIGSDMKDMWDSISEINKRVENIQYSKIRMLEAYYRFAPKNVERLLKKNSIVEVNSGDRSVVSGTLGMLGIDSKKENNLKKLASIIGFIGNYQKDHDSIIIGKAPDMSRIQLMFMENENQTVKFFTEMFNMNVQSKHEISFSACIYYDDCTFGVLGNEDETSTYLYSNTQQLLTQITTFTTNLKLGLVISEKIRKRENITGPLRFIGYFGIGPNGNPIKFYEVLDAYPAAVRAQRISILDKYNEALDLYYQKDFYIARTKFSEILKEDPEDTLIKWYVFESDRYLNENVEDDRYRFLHN